MIFTPDKRTATRRALIALGVLALVLPLGAANSPDHLQLAREALAHGDGIAAQVEIEKALEDGATRPTVAALMGEAMLAQGNPRAAREWLGEAEFVPEERELGFRMIARLEMAEGNPDNARLAFQELLKGSTGSADTWVEIGRLAYSVGDHRTALDAAITAIERDPQNPRALLFRGQLVRDAQGNRSAKAWFERGMASDPSDIEILAEYAATLAELGEYKSMLAATRRMVELDPENPKAFFLQALLAARAGRDDLARRLMWRVDGRFRQTIASAMLLDGVLELRAGNPGSAAEVFGKLHRRQPDNEKVTLLYGKALLDDGSTAELVSTLAPRADRPEASPYLLSLVGRALEIEGKRLQASTYLDRATALKGMQIFPVNPSNTDEIVLTLWRDDPMRLDHVIAQTRQYLAQGMNGQTVSLITEAQAKYSGSTDVLVLAGDVFLLAGDPAKAIEQYKWAAQIRKPLSLVMRTAVAAKSLSRDPEARALLGDYLAEHPQDDEAAVILAELCAQAGQWKRASLLFEHALALGRRSDPRVLAGAARSNLQLGQTGQALEQAETAYALQRSNERTASVLAAAFKANGAVGNEARVLLTRAGPANAFADIH